MSKRDESGDFGIVTEPGTIQMRRVLPGPIERVWSYLVDSEKRGLWFAAGPMEQRPGGKFELVFDHASLSDEKKTPEKWKSAEGSRWKGTLIRFEPPHVLSWSNDDHTETIFELTAQGKDVLLVLTHRRIPSPDMMKGYSGGWHSHLNVLRDRLNNIEPKGFWTNLLRIEDEYQERMKNAKAFEKAPAIEVRVTQQFTAAPERVFDAWLDTKMIGQFMFGPQLRDEEIVRLTLDGRVGGRFSFVVRRQGQEIDHIGRYLEIDRPRRLVFTWAVAPDKEDASRVIVEITPAGTGCELTLTHEMGAEWADYRGRVTEGWTKMLGALAGTFKE